MGDPGPNPGRHFTLALSLFGQGWALFDGTVSEGTEAERRAGKSFPAFPRRQDTSEYFQVMPTASVAISVTPARRRRC